MQISKDYLKQKKNPHLHSPSHFLADELASKLGDPKHFGFYLKTALNTDHNVLRHILGGILEGNSKQPGALFAYLVKKYNREKDISQGFSIWLIPNEESFKILSSYIQELAQTFDSPVFKPHITLADNLEPVESSVIEHLASTKTFTLKSNGIKIGDEFFKSLFISFDKSKELLALRRQIKKNLNLEFKGTYDPHISLLYSNLPDDQKKSAIKELKLLVPPAITFNRLAVVHTTGKTKEWKTKQLINLSE